MKAIPVQPGTNDGQRVRFDPWDWSSPAEVLVTYKRLVHDSPVDAARMLVSAAEVRFACELSWPAYVVGTAAGLLDIASQRSFAQTAALDNPDAQRVLQVLTFDERAIDAGFPNDPVAGLHTKMRTAFRLDMAEAGLGYLFELRQARNDDGFAPWAEEAIELYQLSTNAHTRLAAGRDPNVMDLAGSLSQIGYPIAAESIYRAAAHASVVGAHVRLVESLAQQRRWLDAADTAGAAIGIAPASEQAGLEVQAMGFEGRAKSQILRFGTRLDRSTDATTPHLEAATPQQSGALGAC